jgi:hypothetical protein
MQSSTCPDFFILWSELDVTAAMYVIWEQVFITESLMKENLNFIWKIIHKYP